MKIFLGADHRGYKLKNKVCLWLEKHGVLHEDLGNYELDLHDDYTQYAQKVASAVANNNTARGILLCGSGVGVDIVANKFDGIRASIGKEVSQIEAGRKHDDMNILVIAADFTSEMEAIAMVKAFLETKFDGKSRHKRRLQEISRLEENN